MLYITIILVASGLFLIIYSLFTSSSKKNYIPKAKQPAGVNNGYLQEHEKEPAAIEEFTALNTHKNAKIDDDFDAESLNLDIPFENKSKKTDRKQEEKDWHAPELDDLNETADEINEGRRWAGAKETAVPDKVEGNSYSAVLYEDSSNILDYDNRSSIIDSTLKEYGKIRRMGKGSLELKDNCINFSVENKNFRYDFHRISKFIGGNNYISLFLKKSKTARLFIFDKDSSIGIKLERIFNEYTRGAS